MRIALLGVGSLGTALGAMISEAGQEILLIDGYDSHVKALNENGATITGKMHINASVKACRLHEIKGNFDIVFYLAKSTNNEAYLPAILPHLHDKSIFCTLQNGLPEEAVSQFVGKERVIGGFVFWGASLLKPGVTEMTTGQDQLIYEIGEMEGGITSRLYKAKKILDLAGKCIISENLMRIRWTKLSFNSALSGMSAALGCTYGDVLNNKKALMCAAFIKNEVIKVAHAQGIKLLTIDGTNFEDFEIVNGKSDFERVKPLIINCYKGYRKVIASMLYDMRLGRKTEIEAINGVITFKGDMLGFDTPFNDKVVELVKEAEANKTINTFANLEKFNKILTEVN